MTTSCPLALVSAQFQLAAAEINAMGHKSSLSVHMTGNRFLMLICLKAAQPHSALFHFEHSPSIQSLGLSWALSMQGFCIGGSPFFYSACQVGINITLGLNSSKTSSFEIAFIYPFPCCLRAGVPRNVGSAVRRRGSCGEGAAAGAPALDRTRPLSNAPPRAVRQNHSRGVLADLSTPARCWNTAS